MNSVIRHHLLLTLCLGLTFFGTSAAQSTYRTEVFGSVGVSEYVVGFGPSVRGFNFGGGVGVRPFSPDRSPLLRMLGFEFEANGTRRGTSGNQTETQGYVTGNVLFHASIGRVEPYLLMGGGVSRAGETHRAGDVGMGGKIFLTPRLSARPEVRVFVSEYLGSFARVSAAVGYHW